MLGGGGHDDGEIEQFSNGGVRHYVLAVESGVPITGHLVQANLQVEDEEKLYSVRHESLRRRRDVTYGVVLVDALPWDGCDMLEVSEE